MQLAQIWHLWYDFATRIADRRVSDFGQLRDDGSHRVPYPVKRGAIMAGKCDICGKSPSFGHSVSHSKRHTKRRWMPNIQKTTILVHGRPKQINVCAKCLKSMRKAK
jgi:large subunit ribosomal protein L28